MPSPYASPRAKAHSRASLYIALALALIVVAIAVTGSLLLAGVVRLGEEKVSSISVASKVSGTKPSQDGESIDSGTPRIFLCAGVEAYDDSLLQARWYRGAVLLGVTMKKFSKLGGGSSWEFLPARSDVVFYLDRPAGGWADGTYTAAMLIDGKQKGKAQFRVGASSAEEDYVLYTYPGGAFSIRVPGTWKKADIKGEKALAGFVAPSGDGYAPRFAVSLTDFTSAGPDYLNSRLGIENSAEQFKAYSLGQAAGARREYTWTQGTGSSKSELTSIQVVLQGPDGVYSLDCHCAKDQFAARKEELDHIVNSFRLRKSG